MLPSFWQRIDSGARLGLPFAITLLCTLLGVMAWPLPYLGSVAPPLAFMAIYYWTIHRPDLLGSSLVFVIGLLHDLLNGLPPGISALIFVVAHQVLIRQRRFFAGHSFFMMWFGFALAMSLVLIIEWLLVNLVLWQVVPLIPVLVQIGLAIVFFPLPCWIFIYLQRTALSQS